MSASFSPRMGKSRLNSTRSRMGIGYSQATCSHNVSPNLWYDQISTLLENKLLTAIQYGKLSDIFGRKRCLQAAYILFAAGTLCSGMARSMPQIIASRALEGCGGAGMVCMVSILLTDLVPLHKVAVYRSYVNLVQTTGRSCGGMIGGYMAQTFGWRWYVANQGPLAAQSSC